MKPYRELTRLGRLRRLRQLAEAALKEYGLSGSQLTFLHYEGNVIFRVDAPGNAPSEIVMDPNVGNRYALRILSIGDTQAINSELTWLAALTKEAGLPVPQPVPTLDGRLLITITTPGVPHGRVVSLMRWIDGRQLSKGLRPHHLQAWGRVMGRLHKFAADWQPPEGFKRFIWDWDGLLGGRDFHHSMEELVESIPQQFREPYKIVSQQAREVMESFGKGPDAYGMIHGDMYPENVLFKGRDVYIIDFEDCGFGYWMWDIGVALGSWTWTDEWHWMRDASLEGYTQIRSLPEAQLRQLDLFMAVSYAMMVLWATAFIKQDPAMQTEYEEWRTREGEKLLRYFERDIIIEI